MSYRPRSKSPEGKRAQMRDAHRVRAGWRWGRAARPVVFDPDPSDPRHLQRTVSLQLISGAELKVRLAPAQATAILKMDPSDSFSCVGQDGKEVILRAGAVLGARL